MTLHLRIFVVFGLLVVLLGADDLRALSQPGAIARLALAATVMGFGVVWVLREARARERAEMERAGNTALLRDAYTELRDLYDDSPCGYHSLDPDGVIIRINETHLGWLGYTRDEVIGRMHITDIIAPGEGSDFRAIFGKIRRGDRAAHIQTRYRHKNGMTFPVQVSVQPLQDEGGQLLQMRATVMRSEETRIPEAVARRA